MALVWEKIYVLCLVHLSLARDNICPYLYDRDSSFRLMSCVTVRGQCLGWKLYRKFEVLHSVLLEVFDLILFSFFEVKLDKSCTAPAPRACMSSLQSHDSPHMCQYILTHMGMVRPEPKLQTPKSAAVRRQSAGSGPPPAGYRKPLL